MDSPPHSIGQVNKGYRQCRFITRGTARNLYYAFLPLTLQQRRSLCAVFRFCRRCGDIADSPAAPEAKARALLEQELLIHRLYGGEDFHGDPEAAALADTIRRYRIPQRYFCDFLAGIRRDLVTVRYWSFEELRTYCYGVASAVGLIALEIIGYDRRRAAEARAATVDLGLAVRLTDILRDIRVDAARGRIYLPEIEWREYDLTEADLAAGVVDERFRAFMAFQINRVRHLLARARALSSCVSRRARACPATLQALYTRLLDRMERTGYDVYRLAPSLSEGTKMMLMAAAVARCWLLPARLPADAWPW